MYVLWGEGVDIKVLGMTNWHLRLATIIHDMLRNYSGKYAVFFKLLYKNRLATKFSKFWSNFLLYKTSIFSLCCRSSDPTTSGSTRSAKSRPPEVTVVFHVLIPRNDKCRVFVRFGHPRLGKWNKDCGQFECVR